MRVSGGLRREDGFTVIELLVVVALLLVVVGSAYSVLDTSTQTEAGQRARADALDEMRSGMNQLTKELRQAVSVSTSSAPSSLEMDTLLGGVEHVVVYDVVDGVLRRKVGDGAPVPLVRGVRSPAIFCYDPPTCELTAPESVNPSIVRVTFLVGPATRGAEPIEFSSDVNLRNSGSGL